MSAQSEHAASKKFATDLLIVTGLSGAGRTAALKFLEDLGYETVTNLPLSLLERLTAGDDEAPATAPAAAQHPTAIAVGIDSRTRDFAPHTLAERLSRLRTRENLRARMVFLDCDSDILASRFAASRRPHPLAADRPAQEGIARETALLHPIRDLADLVIDSSHLTLPDLRRLLAGHFALGHEAGLAVAITSFAYRRGLPREADLILDARFLDNPHYVPELETLSGEDPAVAAFIERDSACAPFFRSVEDLLHTLILRYQRDGKPVLSIGIGCTGGRHRSVFVAGRLAERLRSAGHRVMLNHRDLQSADKAEK